MTADGDMCAAASSFEMDYRIIITRSKRRQQQHIQISIQSQSSFDGKTVGRQTTPLVVVTYLTSQQAHRTDGASIQFDPLHSHQISAQH